MRAREFRLIYLYVSKITELPSVPVVDSVRVARNRMPCTTGSAEKR